MPKYCPKCGSEFRSEKKTCPTHGVKLTEKCPTESEIYVDIYAASNQIEADYLMGTLENNGLSPHFTSDGLPQRISTNEDRFLISVSEKHKKKAVEMVEVARKNQLISEDGEFI